MVKMAATVYVTKGVLRMNAERSGVSSVDDFRAAALGVGSAVPARSVGEDRPPSRSLVVSALS